MKLDTRISYNTQFDIDGQSIGAFSASIDVRDELNYSTNKAIYDQQAYRKNRAAVNKAFDEFEDEIYKIIDEIEAGTYAIKEPRNY